MPRISKGLPWCPPRFEQCFFSNQALRQGSQAKQNWCSGFITFDVYVSVELFFSNIRTNYTVGWLHNKKDCPHNWSEACPKLHFPNLLNYFSVQGGAKCWQRYGCPEGSFQWAPLMGTMRHFILAGEQLPRRNS